MGGLLIYIMPWYSVFYGLSIESSVPLLELPEKENPVLHIDVRVKHGKCPLDESARAKTEHFNWGHQNALLFWQDFGCFWIREGREVIVEPAQGVADHLLRPILLGPVMAILLLQRGFLVLHASAVAFQCPDGTSRAAGFLGHSGQGKSTMATALHQRGHRALADDTIAVPVSNDLTAVPGWPLVYPALPHFKLRFSSAHALGEDVKNLSLWHPDNDSYVVPLSSNFSLTPAPLHSLYCLEEGGSLRLQRMNHEEALMNLLEHSYCMRLLPDGEIEADFLKCAQLAKQIPVFELQRPKDFRCLPDVVRVVEDHQKSLLLEEAAS